ncbi:N-acetylmuramoyl-L-alanine amidase [Marinococcus halophilus]|uniref:MurNAc-LAA domain-containing protein n=1 Tax=Marinococcus halophilus TaxID=1371 RepID=A0A510Y8W8_MARHA|nr:N-acetylmuramoyl-L-alanine amidase [Marinococcus halophilus]OZT79167.1 N-acetylmuramoyl-L-alanine amidase [Marinococcus halophilus]GEK59828.1 hypothetical protein MHA01_27330 [Marinococcus halophilus]
MKKYIGIVLTIFLLGGGVFVNEAEASVEGKTVALDAGHGGEDPGALDNGLHEKELVYDVAYRTKQRLEQAGAEVVMTRERDEYLPLEDRAEIANRKDADIFVSVHANAAATPYAEGTETYHYPTSEEGQRLAFNLQEHMVDEFGSEDRGVKTANFSVLRNTEMPAALVELGFVTNKQEAERMKDSAFRNEAANALYLGIHQHF